MYCQSCLYNQIYNAFRPNTCFDPNCASNLHYQQSKMYVNQHQNKEKQKKIKVGSFKTLGNLNHKLIIYKKYIFKYIIYNI